jgi:hypothetical protein
MMAATTPKTRILIDVHETHKIAYARSHSIQLGLRLARPLPTKYQIGTLVTTPNTNTVNRVTSMNGNDNAHAVGAAIRKSTAPARLAAKSPMSPADRKPTDNAATTRTNGNMSPRTPPRSGETVERRGANDTSCFTTHQSTSNSRSRAGSIVHWRSDDRLT